MPSALGGSTGTPSPMLAAGTGTRAAKVKALLAVSATPRETRAAKSSKPDQRQDSAEDDEGNELFQAIAADAKAIKNNIEEESDMQLRLLLAEAREQIDTHLCDHGSNVPFLDVTPSGPAQRNDSNSATIVQTGTATPISIKLCRIPKCEPVPQANTYVSIRRNVSKEDDKKLRFLPYFGENDKSSIDFSVYSSDEEEDEPEEPHEDDTVVACVAKYGYRQEVLEALSHTLNFSPDALRKRLADLLQLHARKVEMAKARLGRLNTDAENNDMLMDSYEKLFCRRCFVYDCRQHGMCQPRPRGESEQRLPSELELRRYQCAGVSKSPDISLQPAKAETNADIDRSNSFGESNSGSSSSSARRSNSNSSNSSKRSRSSNGSFSRSVSSHTSSGRNRHRRVRSSSPSKPMANPRRSKRTSANQTSRDEPRRVTRKRERDRLGKEVESTGKRQMCRVDMQPEAISAAVEPPSTTTALAASEEDHESSPCGKYCHKLEAAVTIRTKAERHRNRFDEAPEDEHGWTELDKVLLRKVFFVTGRHFCAMAKIMDNKTCHEIFAFVQRFPGLAVHSTIPPHPESPCDANNKKKKPKKKHRPSHAKAKTQPHPRSYLACDHAGCCFDADPEVCVCKRNQTFCEKYCACSPSCRNRFPGCQCKGCRCRTRACPCYAANRECDPDLCGMCVPALTCPVETPEGKEEDKGDADGDSEFQCHNFSIQLRRRKHLLLGRSSIHGWGAFCLETTKKQELLTEYLGELISQDEADRRGKIYDKLNRSYLFNLNEEYVVDAARKGNKIKFANHSDNPNCFSRVMKVAGDHRIGIYAKRKIRAGEELFFDYQHEHAGKAPEWFVEQKEL